MSVHMAIANNLRHGSFAVHASACTLTAQFGGIYIHNYGCIYDYIYINIYLDFFFV